MKAKACLTLCAVVAATLFVPASPATADPTKKTAGSPGGPAGMNTTKTLPKSQDADRLNETHTFEKRTGEAVARSAQKLLLHNKYFAKAHADLVSRGLKPAFKEHGVTIVAVPKQQASRQGPVRFEKASFQDEVTISDGTYEMSFYPYYNGNNAVWEGIVTLRGGGNDDVDYVMFDVTNENTVPTLSEYNYSNNGGGGCGACGGGGGGGELMTRYSGPGSKSLFQRVSYTPSVNFAPPAPQSGGRLQRWAWCAAGGCWGGIFPCRWAGPAWAECAAANCIGQMIGCAIQNMV